MTRHSRGIALITALLVVAIATLAATALLSTANLAIHRTAALRDSEQGWWVARGVESWILGILEKDLRQGQYDGLGEDWALPVDYLPVEQGYVRGQVIDLHRCFNLNNLVLAEKGKAPASEVYRKQLERLLATLPSELQASPGLVGAIIDWADADQNPNFPDGAEDSIYLQQNPPYRTADRPFTVLSELLAVRGVTPPLYEELRRRNLVCAVPEFTKVNVNTADEAVLRALSDTPPDETKFRQFLERRAEQPAQSVEEFNRDGGLPGAHGHIAVASEYFQIQGEVFVGSSRVALYSLIRRPGTGAPVVLAHSADAE
jgi:general secretion pathway protein K